MTAAASSAYLDEPLRTGAWRCAGDACTGEGAASHGRYTVVFEEARDGSLHIIALELYRWSGCLC